MEPARRGALRGAEPRRRGALRGADGPFLARWPRRAGLGAGTERSAGVGMRECSESAGTGVCSQEPVGEGALGGCAGAGGRGDASGYALGSEHWECTGVPGRVDTPELLGAGSCGYTGPADIEVCGYAGHLAVSGSLNRAGRKRDDCLRESWHTVGEVRGW